MPLDSHPQRVAAGVTKEAEPLAYVNLYCTSQCNSRCVTCDFWQRPVQTLEPAAVESVVNSRFVDGSTWLALQGGEFVLHPQADELLEMASTRQYILFTNLLAPARVEALVKRHQVPFVSVSLDGGPQGYAKIRGVDAFAKVTQGILRLRQFAEVSVGITLTPWSSLHDYYQASHFCREYGIDFGVNLYTNSRIYGANGPLCAPGLVAEVARDCGDAFCSAYASWVSGKLQLPCQSIRRVVSIGPDGTVHLCHNRQERLGNLRDSTFDSIWTSHKTLELHTRYTTCNDCWTSCYREYDLADARIPVDQPD